MCLKLLGSSEIASDKDGHINSYRVAACGALFQLWQRTGGCATGRGCVATFVAGDLRLAAIAAETLFLLASQPLTSGSSARLSAAFQEFAGRGRRTIHCALLAGGVVTCLGGKHQVENRPLLRSLSVFGFDFDFLRRRWDLKRSQGWGNDGDGIN